MSLKGFKRLEGSGFQRIRFYFLSYPIFQLIALSIALQIVARGGDSNVLRKAAALGDLIFAVAVVVIMDVGAFLTGLVSGFYRGEAGINPPDQHVYVVSSEKEAVVLAQNGNLGKFNRAQRAIFNTQEWLAIDVAKFLLVTQIAPRAAVIFALIWAIGRFLYAVGYANEKRVPGFLLAKLIASNGAGSFLLFLTLRAFGYWPAALNFVVPASL